MTARVTLDLRKFADVFGAMFGLGKAIESSGLDHKLLYLVDTRVSQINGCGYCIDMHTKDARLEGETEQRLYLLSAWREATIYSPRERAALAWAEAVTKLENGAVPDEVYAQAREQFDEQELMKLTLAVVGINGWNRFNIAFNNPPGTYKAGSMSKLAAAQR
ncbi:MAG TPA: carboxymuconolactone decarboxylase family protein [Steroidobacteraceae bacterium]|jgi:AhpD family alkylhydroperoxidase